MQLPTKEGLLDEILARIPPSGNIADSDLLALAILFDENTVYLTLEAALGKEHIVAITAKTSGRKCFEFRFAGALHLCFLDPIFCTCDEVAEALLAGNPEVVLCKHLFAVKLAVAASTTCQELVSDGDFASRTCEALAKSD